MVLNGNVREDGRKLFTLAHEIGHYLLPDQQNRAGPCTRNEIAQWSSKLPLAELEANRFAAEILMPEVKIAEVLQKEPQFDLVFRIAEECQTTLTAATYRYVELSSFRIAMVWSTKGQSIWYKPSQEFGRAIELGSLSTETYAHDCFEGREVPKRLEPVPAKAWLYDSNLKDDAKILEQSIYLPFYTSALSLLYLREQVERRSHFDEEDESELDPNEFTVYRRKWPGKN